LIPGSVEILGSSCFYNCLSLSSITFESNSHLTRIESGAFLQSKLQSILIPSSVEILGSSCFYNCLSLSSITFESNSQLTRIESGAFLQSSLQSILIPSSVEILGSSCFSNCLSLSSITFESNSQLTRIESEVFSRSSLQSIILPSTILFVAYDAVDIALQELRVDGDFCPEFDRWQQLRKSGVTIDFRRIQRLDPSLRCFTDYIVNLSVFGERSIIGDLSEVSNKIYHRIEDEVLVVVKSKPQLECVNQAEMENEIELLINLRHPCIAAPIGVVLPIESISRQKLKIVRLYLESCSLTEVLSVRPVWWTSTMKAKVIVGIVLALRFAHSLGLVHGS
jgi:hypothetical protein